MNIKGLVWSRGGGLYVGLYVAKSNMVKIALTEIALMPISIHFCFGVSEDNDCVNALGILSHGSRSLSRSVLFSIQRLYGWHEPLQLLIFAYFGRI